MRDTAEVVIVGGGIMGLSIAYNLAQNHGVTDVTVVDKSYLCGGASGRNGGGVRAQWSERSQHPADAGEHPACAAISLAS